MALPPVGARVRVPVGSRTLTGCVVEHDAAIVEGTEAKDILAALDPEPLVPPAIVDLCRWVAEYYVAGIGDALGVAMPPGARASKARGFKRHRIAAVTVLGSEPGDATAHGRESPHHQTLTPKQRNALAILAGAPAGLPTSELRDRGVTADVLVRLVKRGLASVRDEQDARDPFERAALVDIPPDAARDLTEEQRCALATLSALADAHDFRVALLHGVTGSGKTEIYLRLAERVCRAGGRVLLMVPEIALTPSVAAVFRGTFGSNYA